MNSPAPNTTGKWAVVTGASGGLGLEFARLLAARGYHLVLVARSQPRLASAASSLGSPATQIRCVPLDLALPDAPDALLRQTDAWGISPEVLINNAGAGDWGRFLDTPLASADTLLQLNISALVRLSHLYGRHMRERRCGYILQVASTAAFQPVPSYAVYAATKSFVLSFSRALHYEGRKNHVSSTALCPGPTRTDFFSNARHTPNAILNALMMPPARVARQGLDAMFRRRALHVPGLLNKLTTLAPRILPSRCLARAAALFTH